MGVTVNYTQEELDDLLSRLDNKYNTYICKLAKKNLYKIGVCDMELLKELFLYKWSLSYWQQNANGSTTGKDNYLTQEQFNCITFRIKSLTC
jgi:hypothetical protein